MEDILENLTIKQAGDFKANNNNNNTQKQQHTKTQKPSKQPQKTKIRI